MAWSPAQGHILGLSHDGDLGAGNSCRKESGEGSVMAPMVAATFSYFHWSSCSAGEYHYKVGPGSQATPAVGRVEVHEEQTEEGGKLHTDHRED